MATTDQWIVLVIFTLILWLIVGPFCIWCLYKYYAQRDNIIIQKRGYGLTMVWGISSTLALIIERPYYLFIFTLHYNPAKAAALSDTSTSTQITFAFGLLLFQLLFYSPYWMLALKYWKIFYSIKWAKATMNGKWKMHLNHIELNKNWYLRNKNKYGSIHYMRKIVFILWLIFSVISIFSIVVIRYNSPGLFIFLQFIVSFVPSFILPICLYIPMRKFVDSFYIVAEMKYLTFSSILVLIVYISLNVMSSGGNLSMYTRTLTLAIFTIICSVAFIVVQTIVVLNNVGKMIKNISHNNSNRKLLDNVSSQSSKSSKTLTDIDIVYNEKKPKQRTDETKAKKTIHLSSVLETECLFEKFASHLIREWSMELILSFCEISQFQQLIDGNSEMFTQIQRALFKNKAIPQSFVVFSDIKEVMKAFDISGVNGEDIDKIKEYKIRAYALYLKYIQSTCELQINISYSHKCELENLMKQMNVFINNVKITEKELFELYNHVLEEIGKLLNFSFHRFVADGTYEELSLSK